MYSTTVHKCKPQCQISKCSGAWRIELNCVNSQRTCKAFQIIRWGWSRDKPKLGHSKCIIWSTIDGMSRFAYTYRFVKIFTGDDSPQDGTGCRPSWDRGRCRVALEIQQTKLKFHRLLVLCTQPAKPAQGVPQIHTFTSILTAKRAIWPLKVQLFCFVLLFNFG